MRRAILVLASTLAAAAIAGAFLYGRGSPGDEPRPLQLATPVELAAPQAREPQPMSSAATEPTHLTSPPTATPVPRTEQSPSPAVDDRPIRRRGPARDLATILAEQRTQAIQDIRQWYSLLLDDLDLTPEQRTDLVTVLAELQVDAAWIGGQDGEWLKRGRTIGARERHERIAAAIGERKLDELLVLEVNLASYSETQDIASLLRRKQVPLTETQRDGLFEILVEVRDRYPDTDPDVDHRSLEYIDQRLAEMDDFDRHVIELAPSVLSATQVARLSEEYQWMARQRIDSIEMQKKRRIERPDDDVGWAMPARWNPH